MTAHTAWKILAAAAAFLLGVAIVLLAAWLLPLELVVWAGVMLLCWFVGSSAWRGCGWIRTTWRNASEWGEWGPR